MAAPRYALDPQVTSVVKRRVLSRIHERQLLQDCLAVARTIEKELCAAVERDQEIFVARMAGVYETLKSLARLLNLVAAHRARNVEQDPDRDRGVRIAEKSYFLLLIVIENGE